MTTVAVLGSTGSIGTQTLDVVRAEPGRYEVVVLGACRSVDLLAEQAKEFRPRLVAVVDPEAAAGLADRLPPGTELTVGEDALADAAREAEVVVNGVVGFAGLGVTLAALESGRRLALANKESLIAAGPVVQRVRSTPGAELIPVDSEHGAIHQCLRANLLAERVARLVVTASGGPFRGRSRTDLADVTIDDALAHPTWSMGPKITIDSSTLMNKGLEVIEAHELFGVELRRHRRGRAPAVGRALDGRVHRRFHHRPAVDARHAAAHRVRPGLSGPLGRPLRPHRLDDAGLRWTSRPPTGRPSPAWTWPIGPVGRARPPRRGSTRPTRWRSKPSWRGASGGWPSAMSSPPPLTVTMEPKPLRPTL